MSKTGDSSIPEWIVFTAVLLIIGGLIVAICTGCSTPAQDRERERRFACTVADGLAATPQAAEQAATALEPHLDFGRMFARACGGSVQGFVSAHWLEILLGGSAAGLLGKAAIDKAKRRRAA